jgi:Fe-S cluster biogenesis protein NfuA
MGTHVRSLRASRVTLRPALNRLEDKMFIETEPTPNPATLKFLPGRTVLAEGTLDIRDSAAAEHSPLARALFAIDGVSGVFFGRDFVSVTKADGDWAHLKPAILGAIMEHFVSGAPLMLATGAAQDGTAEDEFFDADDEETVETIKDLIETRVRPAVAGDGGDITFKGFRGGIVYLSMRGACAGCPSSTATLKSGIQNLLKHFVPEVHAVEQI